MSMQMQNADGGGDPPLTSFQNAGYQNLQAINEKVVARPKTEGKAMGRDTLGVGLELGKKVLQSDRR